MKITLTFFASLVLVIVFALGASAQDTPTDVPKPEPTPDKVKLERDTKFDGDVEFPEVDGWELSEKMTYPSPDLGYSVNYESPSGGRVTVYVYQGGRKSIPNELTGVVANELKRAKSDIKTAVEAGLYQEAKELVSETVTLGGEKGAVKALHSGYMLKARGTELDSHIYIFPYQNYFIKIRATRRKTADSEANEAITELFAELDLLFSK